MRVIWFVVLALLAFVLGAFGGATWNVTKSGLAGVRVACEVAATAEKSGILTRAQIGEAVDRLAKSTGVAKEGGTEFFNELKTGCPNFSKLGGR